MKKIILKIALFGIISVVLCAMVGTVTLIYFSFTLPKISKLSDYKPPLPSRILSEDGTILAEIYLQKREIVPMDKVPQRIVDAFLSAEDSNFYDHSGVDYISVFRAFIANLKAGRVVQGGSTITQQVAKSLLLTRERSLTRKIKDFLLAQKIEEKFSKDEILYLYLNQVYLGGGYYGVKSAFQGYFDKSLEEATVAEAAIIAGLLVAPGRYSPYINPKRAKGRQEYVLKRMLANKKISQQEYEEALNEKIKFKLRIPGSFKAGYFTDWVRQRVVAQLGEEEFKVGGYTVQTTLDWELQSVGEKAVSSGVKEIDKRQGYKGPLANLNKEQRLQFDKEFREKLFLDKSTYFTISQDYGRDYELNIDLEFRKKIDEHNEKVKKILKLKRTPPGYVEDDQLLEVLDVGENYEAYVTAVDNRERLIYVSVGGVVGVIPYDGFKWAHERVISENRHFFPFVTRPSSILKPGDKILVKLERKSTGIFNVIYNKNDSSLLRLSADRKSLLRKQKYLLCSLDQDADVQGALVSLDVFTGKVRAFIGGSDFSKSQFNRAIQSLRQPGSSFKPLLFASALENGFNPASIIIDSPETLGGVDETLNWKPRNYDGRFKGPITFRNSLEQSRNVPTIKIASEVGVDKIIAFLNRIGFKADVDQDLSLALGSFGVTLLDLVSTYAIFPNGGRKVIPKTILSVTDRDGNIVKIDDLEYEKEEEKGSDQEKIAEENTNIVENEMTQAEKVQQNPFHTSLDETTVYDPRLAFIMTNLLRGVVLHGTGASAKSVSHFLGGKTGTTNNYVDAWFLGFSNNTATGVWTGFDENETLGWAETGAKSALPIWKEFMKKNLRKYGENEFRTPLGIVNVLIDKETGKPVVDSAKNGFMESFVEGFGPLSDGSDQVKSDENIENVELNLLEEDDYYQDQ
jgi:penicillin-binding protein 1A